jgi:hypothetical protein
MAERSEEGSVCERGVVGRLDEMLSSEVLLSWRTRVLDPPMVSVSVSASSRILVACMSNDVLGVAAKTVGETSSSITSAGRVGALVGLRTAKGSWWELWVVMALSRWMRSSCRGSSFAVGGKDTLGVMAAHCLYT